MDLLAAAPFNGITHGNLMQPETQKTGGEASEGTENRGRVSQWRDDRREVGEPCVEFSRNQFRVKRLSLTASGATENVAPPVGQNQGRAGASRNNPVRFLNFMHVWMLN